MHCAGVDESVPDILGGELLSEEDDPDPLDEEELEPLEVELLLDSLDDDSLELEESGIQELGDDDELMT